MTDKLLDSIRVPWKRNLLFRHGGYTFIGPGLTTRLQCLCGNSSTAQYVPAGARMSWTCVQCHNKVISA